jgi:cation transport ATPase
LGKPKDLSKKSGNIAEAELYSYTTAMMPNNKETAYLHIPTFISGIFLHIGTFISLLLFIIFYFIEPNLFPCWLIWASSAVLIIASCFGIALFIKRLALKKLRELSTIDDFISNLLATSFQIFTAIYFILGIPVEIYYYILASILLLYLPVGKLRHVVYFFAARYHLGFFYGWRNAWPPKLQD